MKVVIKNFFRNEAANLTIKSVRHFLPEAEVYAMSLYVKDQSEYGTQPPLDVAPDRQFYAATKYHGMGPSVGNKWNNLFFSEPYNMIHWIFKNEDEKVLMLAEDHFFTSGATLRELRDKDFDIAYAPWPSYGVEKHKLADGANGSLLCVRPKRVPFPIPEVKDSVEHVLWNFIEKVPEKRRHALTTRDAIDYKGDGFYSNHALEIQGALKQARIL